MPPGQLPRIIIPKAYSGGREKILIRMYAANGIAENWRQTAVTITYGFDNTFLTFEKFKVIPIQNITNPRKTGIKFLNTDKEFGRIKLKVKKYNPATRKHEFFVEKKLPPHSK